MFFVRVCMCVLGIGLKRLVDIVDNVGNKKLSTNILVVEQSFDHVT